MVLQLRTNTEDLVSQILFREEAAMDITSKQYLFFDLDGTLTDSRPGITRSVQYALKAFDIHVDDLESLLPFIGPPLYESFMRYYHFSEAQAHMAVAKYREYFAKTGIFENDVYEGIIPLLKDLKAKGKTLAIATSKPTVFAVRIAEHFAFAPYFETIIGSELDGSRIHKGEIIAYALEQLVIGDQNQVVMIGDREHDIIGARQNGVSSIGVLYGYGSLEELQKAGADAIVHDVKGLRAVLL
jgi:phosphoglycolate phosphatase